jgi:hypothetical protein
MEAMAMSIICSAMPISCIRFVPIMCAKHIENDPK